MKEKVYVDANVFIYPILNNEDFGEKARKFLELVQQGEIDGITSVLTIDEVLWALQKFLGRKKASEVISTVLLYPNLFFVEVNKSIIADMLVLYTKENLDPRDAIHYATLSMKNLKTIASFDSDFKKIKGISYYPLK